MLPPQFVLEENFEMVRAGCTIIFREKLNVDVVHVGEIAGRQGGKEEEGSFAEEHGCFV